MDGSGPGCGGRRTIRFARVVELLSVCPRSAMQPILNGYAAAPELAAGGTCAGKTRRTRMNTR